MLFNSWHFLALAAVVYPLYFRLPLRQQNWLLLVASYYFYAAWDWRFLSLLVGSTLVDYAVARAISRAGDPVRRRHLLWLSFAFNFGMLGFFKYFNFFAESFASMAEAVGWHVDPVTLRVILPIGISFYTFITVSYVIDVYRREFPPADSLLDFAVFVAYFPHLVAGPILRASSLLPQIQRPRRVTLEQVQRGIWLISWGLFKKVVIADNLAIVVDRGFAAGAGASGADLVVAVYAFAYQIYCDFSGYSDMACGLAALMGIELIVNFRRPYAALDPRDFWRRWHISLSTWLRDYLYIPLGGNRRGRWVTYRALLLTMALGGLWHGAKWTFVVWGLFHGLLLAMHRYLVVEKEFAVPDTAAWRTVGRVVTFHLVCLGWLFFRADSLAEAWAILGRIGSGVAVGVLALKAVAVIAPVALVLAVVERRDGPEAVRIGPARAMMVAALWLAAVLLPPAAGHPFIYFQF